MASCSTLAWLRSVLMLARAGASGALVVRAHGRDATLRLANGAVVGFEGDLGPRLGELVGVSRASTSPDLVWGAAALASGQVSRNDLAWALRRQLRLRARDIARWGDVETHWEPGARALRPFTDPMSVADLVAEVLRAFAELQARDVEAPRARVASALGLYWAENAALFPHEIAAVRGASDQPAAARFAVALAAAGLTDAPVDDDVRALTRLHARVRSEGARAVLGASEGAARRAALRSVAKRIHPDRFAHDARLGSISHELVAKLVGA